MAALGKYLRTVSGNRLLFWCPGCDESHTIRLQQPNEDRYWSFNNNPDAPTFSPSILVTGVRKLTEDEYTKIMKGERVEPTQRRCHSFITDGNIQFLPDSSHSLAGTTVSLPPFPALESL